MCLIPGQDLDMKGTGGRLIGLSDMWKEERVLPTLRRAFPDARPKARNQMQGLREIASQNRENSDFSLSRRSHSGHLLHRECHMR